MKTTQLSLFFSRWAPPFRFIILWITLIVIMTVARLAFVVFEPNFSLNDLENIATILWHGLPGDMCVASYFLVIPGIIQIVRIWYHKKWVRKTMQVYIWIISAIISFIYILDGVLYPFWGFRIDSTPFFYFFTSPGAALASLSWGWEILIVFLIIMSTWFIHDVLRWSWRLCMPNHKKTRARTRIINTVITCVLTGALFIPIRGGFSEATMTPGRGFFSTDDHVNQATINPVFSLLYDVFHFHNPSTQFRFFSSDSEAVDILNDFEKRNTEAISSNTPTLSTQTPDVYVIILESFSSRLMPSLGGDSIATNLDKLAKDESILFTNFYAESFRTDRAIPAILSGYPAQPTTSVIRITSRLSSLPSIIKSLSDKGWMSTYYYGGDPDFTNMKAYLMATGLHKLISESDFSTTQRSAKWGVPDGVLFRRVLDDLKTKKSGPRLNIIQTSSSHEPYDVPRHISDDKITNSFKYTDEELSKFIKGLKEKGAWKNSLVLIVPDHWGSYPENLTDLRKRHQIPLILTGGALKGTPQKINTVGSQKDIAPTLLTLLGIDNADFKFGHNLFDGKQSHYAWVTERDWFGVIDNAKKMVSVSVHDNRVLQNNKNEESPQNADAARAFLRLLYNDLNKR